MTTPHRATPEQWEHVQISAGMKQQIPWATADCLLELRARVEALEAAPRDKLDRLIALDREDLTPDPAMPELRAASAEARPGGLVEGVAAAIDRAPFDEGLHQWDEASAAICAVATWLDRFALHGSGEYAQAAKVLRQEVGQ
jgi:hypothetical protein